MSLTRQNLVIAFWTPCLMCLIGGFAAGYAIAKRESTAELADRTAQVRALADELERGRVREEQLSQLEAAAKKHGIPLPANWPRE